MMMGSIAGAAVAAQAHEHADGSGTGGGQGAWACAKIGGRTGPDALEGSLTLKRARAEWANLPLADQLSLMQGSLSPSTGTPSNRKTDTDTVSVSKGAAVGARDGACDSGDCDKEKAPQAYAPTGAALGWSGSKGEEGQEEEEEEDMELIYDPSLGLYFDPKTNSFFARA